MDVFIIIQLLSTTPFDWYQTYGTLRHVFRNDVELWHNLNGISTFPDRKDCRILILGCGNSPFAQDMIRDGWRGPITNVDFSPVVLEHMSRKYGESFCKAHACPKMQFVCADVTQGLPFPNQSFDLVLCKGTLDAILCGVGSVADAKFVVSECSRVLANGHGMLFLVSNANPDNRVVFLEHENSLSAFWQNVGMHTVNRSTPSGVK